jgi:hypothetical protein
MVVVAHIHTQFPEKFGIPRQSGLVPSALGNVVMEPEYRNPDAFKGIEEFSHLWLLWEFSGEAGWFSRDGCTAAAWWKGTQRCVCNKIAFSPEFDRTLVRETGENFV